MRGSNEARGQTHRCVGNCAVRCPQGLVAQRKGSAVIPAKSAAAAQYCHWEEEKRVKARAAEKHSALCARANYHRQVVCLSFPQWKMSQSGVFFVRSPCLWAARGRCHCGAWCLVGAGAPGATRPPAPVRTVARSGFSLPSAESGSIQLPSARRGLHARASGGAPMLPLAGRESFCLEFGGPGIKPQAPTVRPGSLCC